MTRTQRVIIVVITAAAVRLTAMPAQHITDAERLRVWVAAVNEHVPGELDTAAISIALWPPHDFDAVLASVKRTLSNAAPCGSCADLPMADRTVVTSGFLKRAARLHADIAVLYKRENGYALPSNGRTTISVADGQQTGVASGTVHWEVGRLLLDMMRPDPSRDDDVRLWYRATTAFLQKWNEFYELEPHLARAFKLFPNDATLLLDSGTLHEAFAEARIQNVFLAAERPQRGSGGTRGQAVRAGAHVGSQTAEWQDAERLFRETLAIDPACGEAHLRLAHVLGLRERHAEAETEARRALAGPLTPLLKYYALLFLGRAETALDEREDAHATFDQAAALYPGAQSPHLALSQLDRDRGDAAGALLELAVLSRPLTIALRDDPWWVYNQTHAPSADELLAQLRAADFR